MTGSFDEDELASTEQPVPRPRQRHRAPRRQWLRWVLLGAGVLLLILGSYYELSAHPPGGPGRPVTVRISPGESSSAAVATLAKAGVITSAPMYRLYSLIHGTPTLLPGYYTLPKNSTFGAVHAALAAAPNTPALVVPPGFTLQEIANRIDGTVSPSFAHRNPSFADSFAGLLRSGAVRSPYEPVGSTDLEGLVGAGIYLVTPTTSPRSLLESMVAHFSADARSAGLMPSTTQAGLSSYQLVTAASVVEKEGYLVKNMPQVATVIFNRLAKAMPLQMDSTVLYALGQDGGTVTAQDLKYQSPYNSYLHAGLPPTPICTSSRSALSAVMNPPAGSWLYFTLVSKDGTMAFSTTFADQLKNEALAASRGL